MLFTSNKIPDRDKFTRCRARGLANSPWEKAAMWNK